MTAPMDDAARSENEALRKALAPFAARVEMFSTKIPDDQIVNDDFMFTAGDLREAARLLLPKDADHG